MPLEMFSTVPVKVSVRVKNHLSQTILLYLYRFHLDENCNPYLRYRAKGVKMAAMYFYFRAWLVPSEIKGQQVLKDLG